MINYHTRLLSSFEETGNIVCMGLDPDLECLPFPELGKSERIVKFFSTLFSKMAEKGLIPSAFKPNIGYYSSLDVPFEGDYGGSKALSEIIVMIRMLFPSSLIILDSKRGDIARSSQNYADEAFSSWKADSVTVSPYMGADSINPFKKEGKGFYVLCRTSNPGGADLQNQVLENGKPVYMAVAEKIVGWNEGSGSVGAVVGATHMKELEDIVSYFAGNDVPILVPGVGSQGGSAPDVLSSLKKAGYDARLCRINSSSGLTHPWKKKAKEAPENWLDLSLDNISKLISECTIDG